MLQLSTIEQNSYIIERLDIIHTRILELVYKEETYSLDNLIKSLRTIFKINKSKPIIIKEIRKLRDMGLVDVIDGHPLFINDIMLH